MLVVDNIDHAIAIGKKYRHSLRMVTIEGESLSPGGSMTGGAFREQQQSSWKTKRDRGTGNNRVGGTEIQAGDHAEILWKRAGSSRNMLREAIAEFQEKLRQHYIEQNTAKMNIAQQEKKAEEIRSGYDRINRDQAEIKRQVQEIRLDHDRIAQELESSKQDEQELESLYRRQKQSQNWMNGKKKRSQVTKELEEIRLQASVS